MMTTVRPDIQRLRELTNRVEVPADDIARKVVELLADGLIIIEGNGRIIYASDFTSDLFGYEPGELVGRHIELLVPEPLRDGHGRYREEYIREPSTRRMSEGSVLQGQRKDGELIDLMVALAPLGWNGNTGAVAVIQRTS